MLDGRLQNALEGLVFAAIVVAIAAVVAFLVRAVLKRPFGGSKYYSGAVILGFVLHRVLITALTPHSTATTPSAPPWATAQTAAAVGLDAPFIAPDVSKVESFPQQLQTAVAKLSAEDQATVTEATSFFSFCVGADMLEKDAVGFDKKTEQDLAAVALVKLYRFAQKQGSAMTLRKYVSLAAEFKKQKPEWWSQYKTATEKQ
ncbi:MAG: hypothetical protein Q8M37_05370 [Nevskia sp.]|nr:hypothetical protein [Nevskia sp.]